MAFLVLVVVLVLAIAAWAAYRARRHGTGTGPAHTKPIEGNPEVVAARIERVADNLEKQAAELRAMAEVAKNGGTA
jgi:hypothetical protein